MVTHENVNDHSIKLFRHRYQPILEVQFQVDASPGPKGKSLFYDEFLELIDVKFTKVEGRMMKTEILASLCGILIRILVSWLQ